VQSGDYLEDFATLYIQFASLGEEKSLQNKDNMYFFTRSLYDYLPRFRNEIFSYTFWVAKTCCFAKENYLFV